MTNYITSADLTANVIQGMNSSVYISAANNDVEYMALSFGLQPSEISTPIHYLIREYAIASAYRSMYKDKIGTNNLDLSIDKYYSLYQIQDKEIERIRPFLTASLFTGDASSGNELSRTTVLYRN